MALPLGHPAAVLFRCMFVSSKPAAAVYRVTEPIAAIPEAEPGDHLVVRITDPIAPVELVKRFDRHVLIRLMGDGALDRMRLLAGELMEPGPPPAGPLLSSDPPARPRLVRDGP